LTYYFRIAIVASNRTRFKILKGDFHMKKVNLKKAFGIGAAAAVVAIPVPVIGPITGFLVGSVGSVVRDLSKPGK
jgi:hypothetical protein